MFRFKIMVAKVFRRNHATLRCMGGLHIVLHLLHIKNGPYKPILSIKELFRKNIAIALIIEYPKMAPVPMHEDEYFTGTGIFL